MKGFIELTEWSEMKTIKVYVKVEHICRLCEDGTIYTVDGKRFIVNESIEEIQTLIKESSN